MNFPSPYRPLATDPITADVFPARLKPPFVAALRVINDADPHPVSSEMYKVLVEELNVIQLGWPPTESELFCDNAYPPSL